MWQFFVLGVALLHGAEWLFLAASVEALHHHHKGLPYFAPGGGAGLQLKRMTHGQHWSGRLAGLFKRQPLAARGYGFRPQQHVRGQAPT